MVEALVVMPDQEILCWQVGGAGLDSSPAQLATLACMVVAQKAWQRSPLLPHFFANQACLLSSPSFPAKDKRRPFQAKRGPIQPSAPRHQTPGS